MRRSTTLRVALAHFLLAPASILAAPAYQFTALDSGGFEYVLANAINNAGQIVGLAANFAVSPNSHAVMWHNGSFTDLNPAANARSAGYDINNAGVVAGELGYGDSGSAATWSSGTWTPLLNPVGSALGVAAGINDSGVAVGSTQNQLGYYEGVRWQGGIPTRLTLPLVESFATSINNSGQIAGSRQTLGAQEATLWTAGIPQTLGALPGDTHSAAYDINDSGIVVGESVNANGDERAALWVGSSSLDLGVLPGDTGSIARAVNEQNWVVGESFSQFQVGGATLWIDGVLYNLNDLIDADALAAGWLLVSASDINDSGWIVGQAINPLLGLSSAYLLAPVPEPEVWALFAAGLALVGVAARRRRR